MERDFSSAAATAADFPPNCISLFFLLFLPIRLMEVVREWQGISMLWHNNNNNEHDGICSLGQIYAWQEEFLIFPPV